MTQPGPFHLLSLRKYTLSPLMNSSPDGLICLRNARTEANARPFTLFQTSELRKKYSSIQKKTSKLNEVCNINPEVLIFT